MKIIKILFIIIIVLSGGCQRVQYVSVSKPNIDTSTTNHFLTPQKDTILEGNDSVKDINKKSNQIETLIIEDDGSYYYSD
ncbi:hypothetical protein EV215_0185 [Hypnocyclicus thermotrophus]|uniref:Uncharacterized protein n=1 Tax=Hypnocyclicus thermotrophus TaxID=1627895 RepID=A0AA46I6B7_9FUSO|nr:hypothetical protein [Hypnocyclicus thermotrophus]TDT72384.1 hypothetical protein EV215_0185 [Hypnocyclicus thermotrophus]